MDEFDEDPSAPELAPGGSTNGVLFVTLLVLIFGYV